MGKIVSLTNEEKRVRAFLIKKIRNSSNRDYWTYYQELSIECGLNLHMSNIQERNKLSNILFKIFEFEHNAGRPLLTSIVYGKRTFKQGKGFFRKLQELKINGAQNKELEELSIKENRRKYEMAAVKFWKEKKNVEKYA
jgi:hypothetical protein